jgi:hypothetical protein
MVVRSNLLLLGASLALASALVGTGCTGNVVAGLPLDGGEPDFVPEPSGNPEADRGDARVARADAGSTNASGARDAAAPSGSPGRDAGTEPAPDTGAPSAGASDAGKPAEPEPNTDRDYGTDKAKFLGMPRCNTAGALFCDDFESQAVGGQPGPAWKYPYPAKPKIDMTRAARGTKSLLFELAAGAPGHIEETETFPALSKNVFGRMFVWIEGLPTAPADARWTLVGASGSGPMEVRLGGQLNAGKSYYGVGSDGGEAGDFHTPGKESQSIAREKDWTCLEWQFKGDTSETRVWIDGVEQTSLHTTESEYKAGDTEGGKKFTHPTYDKLRIGWWVYQSNATPSPTKMWVDEVAIDKARIGCVE